MPIIPLLSQTRPLRNGMVQSLVVFCNGQPLPSGAVVGTEQGWHRGNVISPFTPIPLVACGSGSDILQLFWVRIYFAF